METLVPHMHDTSSPHCLLALLFKAGLLVNNYIGKALIALMNAYRLIITHTFNLL